MKAGAVALWGSLVSWAPGALALDVRPLPDEYAYPEPAWSPHLVGALIGMLVCMTLVAAKKPIGASSAYSDVAGLIGRAIAPRHVASLQYYQENRPAVGWTLVFVLGAIFGAYVAAATGGELNGSYLQDLWVARFGPDSGWLRTITAIVGGGLMAFGARMAGGCTSGHGISGALQLAVGSWVALMSFFAGGVAVAMLVYST